jgi:zinc protease
MTVERLTETDLRESVAFYRDRFADADDFTFVFVGDLDPDVMRPLVEQYLGALPATERDETWRDTGVRTPRGVHEETVYSGLAPQSQTVITFTGPFDYENQRERARLRATASILESRLFDLLREELGGTYSVTVSPGSQWRPVAEYQMTIQFSSDPGRVDELVTSIFDSVDAFTTEGPTESETADAREALRRQFETDFQQNGTWLSQLVSDYERGATPGEAVDTFPATIGSLTPEGLREAAVRYFDTENYVRVTLMPQEAEE